MRYEIFPTSVWHITETPQHLVDELYNNAFILKKFHEVKGDGFIRSNQGGYQTSQFDWSEFHPEGIKYINKIISEELSSPNGMSYKVIGWWYNINPKGSWNAAHNHQGCDYALVWYLTDSHRCLHLLNNAMIERGSGHFNPDPRKGEIFIFPGNIIHYVMPNPKETDRVCISMNLQLC